MQIKILAKTTLATPTNHPTKSTKNMERRPDGNANANANGNAVLISIGIKSSKVKPAPLAPFVDKMASSEDKTASSESFSASLIENADATWISTGIKSSEVKPAPLAPLMDKTASSEDIYFDASDVKAPSKDIPTPTDVPATASAAAPAAAVIFVPEKTYKTKSEVKSAPSTPSVPKLVPFEEASPSTAAPVTASAAAPSAAATVEPKAVNEMDSKRQRRHLCMKWHHLTFQTLPMHLFLNLLLHLLQLQFSYLKRQIKPKLERNRNRGRHLCQRRRHLIFKTPMHLSSHLLRSQLSNPKQKMIRTVYKN
jgi:hypothetical protein